MTLNRAEIIHRNFLEFLDESEARRSEHGADDVPLSRPLDQPVAGAGAGGPRQSEPTTQVGGRANADAPVTGRMLLELFESQITCRQLDLVAREMRARNEGFYTIGSAGHEGNAVLGRLVRFTDPALIHYRSGAFMLERARQLPGTTPIRDTLLSLAAAADDPISGGRHKVWGSRPLWVPPQTSTIASHLPKSVGMALAIGRMRRLRLPLPVPDDAIVLCSFGDATVNHAVAQTAFNTAAWCAYQSVPVPILFVCEDNGLGISVRTPPGWIETVFSARPGFAYFKGDGLDLADAYGATAAAVDFCRRHRRPTFLHLRTVRLLGHAGSNVETEYHTREQIEAAEALDPLLATARRVMEEGFATVTRIREMYESIGRRVREEAREVATLPRLQSAEEIRAPLAPYHPEAVNAEAASSGSIGVSPVREAHFGGADKLPERSGPRHMAVLLNWGLHDALLKYPQAAVFGEDVAQKGGVYHVTTGLHGKFGSSRVFNTLLDETSILGLAIGAAHLGMLPIPELQYLAYYHNAQDQVRGEACSLQYFSKAQFANPMVVRIAAMGYQKGFGGHFHNDNSVAALRDIPGLVVALPARGDDAVKMLRTCLALAQVDGRVVAFLEPIALYMTKDLYAADDRLWQFDYPPPGEAIPLGAGAVYDADGALVSGGGAPGGDGGAGAMPTPNVGMPGVDGRRPRDDGAPHSREGFGSAAAPNQNPRRKSGAGGEMTSKRGAMPGAMPKRSAGMAGSLSNRPSGVSHRDSGDREDLTIITFGNGLYLSLRAARTLRQQHDIAARVVDIRWLAPLNEDFIVAQALHTGRALVVDECRRSGGLAEPILAAIAERTGGAVALARVTADDVYIPLGPAANLVLPSEERIVEAARVLVGRQTRRPRSTRPARAP